MEDDGWILVVDKKKEPHKSKSKHKFVHTVSAPPFDPSLHQKMLQDVQSSAALKTITDYAVNLLTRKENPIQKVSIQALGLGNIVTDKKPRIQYELLNHLAKQLRKYTKILTLNVYDPVFDDLCRQLLRKSFSSLDKLTIQPFESNKQIARDELQIFYMPHCEKSLYKLILEESHGPKENFMLIGNSLIDYLSRQKILKEAVTIVFEEWAMKQEPVPDYQSAFNDTFLMHV